MIGGEPDIGDRGVGVGGVSVAIAASERGGSVIVGSVIVGSVIEDRGGRVADSAASPFEVQVGSHGGLGDP